MGAGICRVAGYVGSVQWTGTVVAAVLGYGRVQYYMAGQ